MRKWLDMVCSACGQEWAVWPVVWAPCPNCRVQPGQQCVRPSGHAQWNCDLHVDREREAMAMGLLERCPAAATQLTLGIEG